MSGQHTDHCPSSNTRFEAAYAAFQSAFSNFILANWETSSSVRLAEGTYSLLLFVSTIFLANLVLSAQVSTRYYVLDGTAPSNAGY
jgi:hypothetical protein